LFSLLLLFSLLVFPLPFSLPVSPRVEVLSLRHSTQRSLAFTLLFSITPSPTWLALPGDRLVTNSTRISSTTSWLTQFPNPPRCCCSGPASWGRQRNGGDG